MKRLKINLVVPYKQIFPPLGLVYPHLGLCYLSAYLKKHLPGRLEINYIGFHALEFGILRRIIGNRPDVVGFTSDTANINLIFEIARRIKRVRDVPLLLGGPHITSLSQGLSSHIDIGIIGEGEETFLELIKIFLENKRFDADLLYNVNGICFHRDSQVCVTAPRQEIKDIDSLPYPDRAILKLGNRLNLPYLFYPAEKERGTSLITSRGCPYNCVFCQTRLRWKTVRYNSAQYIAGEIESLRKIYPRLNIIGIVDDLFLTSKPRLEEFVELIKKKGLEKGIAFNINAKAEIISEDILKLLRMINVVEIGLGFESASERVLGFLKNNTVTVKDNQAACSLANKFGIKVNGQFIFGTPGETRQDMEATIDFIKRNRFSHINVSVATPLPGTRLWQVAKELGAVKDGEETNWNNFSLAYDTPGNNIYINQDVPQADFFKLMQEVKKLRAGINRPVSLWHYSAYGILLRAAHKLKRIISGSKTIFLRSSRLTHG
jgi:magnesium-protoporphyrin IX monomethyl ester (oxidative) cyclase